VASWRGCKRSITGHRTGRSRWTSSSRRCATAGGARQSDRAFEHAPSERSAAAVPVELSARTRARPRVAPTTRPPGGRECASRARHGYRRRAVLPRTGALGVEGHARAGVAEDAADLYDVEADVDDEVACLQICGADRGSAAAGRRDPDLPRRQTNHWKDIQVTTTEHRDQPDKRPRRDSSHTHSSGMSLDGGAMVVALS
jgi:hypothetical protein